MSNPALIASNGDSLREAFGKALSSIADEFSNVVVLDADIAGGTGVHHFRKSHPDRFVQFGIAEQNMMAAAGGMAAVGLLPVVTTFAVFCLRAIEQARLSLCYARRNAKIVASHPGLDVGPDGGSAQCLEDLAAFRAIPGMTVISPADATETMLATRDGEVFKRLEEGDPTDLPVVTCLDETMVQTDPEGTKRTITEALDLLAEYETTHIAARYPAEELCARPDGTFALIIGRDGLSLRLGPAPYRRKLVQAERVLYELERRRTKADLILLDNEARPDRVVVRVR